MYFSPYLGKHTAVGIFTIHQDGACNTGVAQVMELLLPFMSLVYFCSGKAFCYFSLYVRSGLFYKWRSACMCSHKYTEVYFVHSGKVHL